jgi:drug/metabolite transporter (DMT)-like permease
MSKRIYLILFIALISVSSTAVVIRYVELVPALTLAFWRMLSASLFLWCYSIKKPQRIISLNNRNRILFAGFFLGMHFALFFVGVRSTSVASATLLANTGPIFTSLLSRLGGQKVSRSVVIGLFISVFGIIIIQWSGFRAEGNNYWGNVFSLLSGFCIAMTYMFASKVRKNTENILYGRSVFLVAAVTILLVTILSGGSIFSFNKSDVVWFVFLGIVPSILGHNMLNYCIKYLSPTAVASIPLGEPIIASAFCYFLFFETVPVSALIGAPFVFCGIIVTVRNSVVD